MVSCQVDARLIEKSLCKYINVCPLSYAAETSTIWNVILIEKKLNVRVYWNIGEWNLYHLCLRDNFCPIALNNYFFICTNNYKLEKLSLEKYSWHHSSLKM